MSRLWRQLTKMNGKVFKTTLIYLIGIYIVYLVFHPVSAGGAYQSNMLSNIYISNFGTGTNTGLDPSSILGYIISIKIISIILNTGVLQVISLTSVVLFMSIILFYVCFIRSFSKQSYFSYLVMLGYPLILLGLDYSFFRAYTLSFALPLCLLICYLLPNLKCKDSELILITIIAWIALGFIWHTFHIIVFLIVIFYFILLNTDVLISQKNDKHLEIKLPLLYAVVFIFTWLMLRDATLSFTLFNPNLDFNLFDFLIKGSFAGIYAYKSFIPISQIDLIRYVGYMVTYLLVAVMALDFVVKYLKSREITKPQLILVSFLLSDIVFQTLYFVASRSISPKILIFLLYPAIIVFFFTCHDISIFPVDLKIWTAMKYLIVIVTIVPLIVTSVAGLYSYAYEYPEKSIPESAYVSSIGWYVKSVDGLEIVSDTHTIGYYRLYYAENNYPIREFPKFVDVRYRDYEEIVSSQYQLEDKTILLVNNILNKKHLIFESLESWNKFEPLDYKITRKNPNLIQIYSDGKVLIYDDNDL